MSTTTRISRRRLSYGSDQQADEQSSPAVVCVLCKLNHKYMSQVHTMSWQNTQARDLAAKFGITPADRVCRPCLHRVTANPNHSP